MVIILEGWLKTNVNVRFIHNSGVRFEEMYIGEGLETL